MLRLHPHWQNCTTNSRGPRRPFLTCRRCWEAQRKSEPAALQQFFHDSSYFFTFYMLHSKTLLAFSPKNSDQILPSLLHRPAECVHSSLPGIDHSIWCQQTAYIVCHILKYQETKSLKNIQPPTSISLPYILATKRLICGACQVLVAPKWLPNIGATAGCSDSNVPDSGAANACLRAIRCYKYFAWPGRELLLTKRLLVGTCRTRFTRFWHLQTSRMLLPWWLLAKMLTPSMFRRNLRANRLGMIGPLL